MYVFLCMYHNPDEHRGMVWWWLFRQDAKLEDQLNLNRIELFFAFSFSFTAFSYISTIFALFRILRTCTNTYILPGNSDKYACKSNNLVAHSPWLNCDVIERFHLVWSSSSMVKDVKNIVSFRCFSCKENSSSCVYDLKSLRIATEKCEPHFI